MDDGTTAAAAAAPERTARHVPHDLLREILIRLPVRSLLRFTGVCKLRHNKDDPFLLIAPQRGAYTRQDRVTVATTGLYRWRESHGDAVLVHPMDSLRYEFVQPLAHCDGLVLVGTTSAVRVLNPATGSVLKLPQTLGGPAASCYTYQAFGLGRDPRTEAYKNCI
ncbi:putative F-box protein At2g02030 [Lolium perenne]|uniref:putative F-box protein At2g02030 n=1 Tax=Lolium perenne TaxID=4522 RepID=UPI003A9906AE